MTTEATTPTAVTMAQSEADRAANEKRIWEAAADSAKKKAARRAEAKSPQKKFEVTRVTKAGTTPKGSPSRAGMAKQSKAVAAATASAKKRTVESDLPAEDRRAAVVKAMIKMGATGAMSSKTAEQIAAKTGFTKFDVYGLLYHTNPLQSGGFVKQCQMEDVRGLSYYLTAKGQKGYVPKA